MTGRFTVWCIVITSVANMITVGAQAATIVKTARQRDAAEARAAVARSLPPQPQPLWLESECMATLDRAMAVVRECEAAAKGGSR